MNLCSGGIGLRPASFGDCRDLHEFRLKELMELHDMTVLLVHGLQDQQHQIVLKSRDHMSPLIARLDAIDSVFCLPEFALCRLSANRLKESIVECRGAETIINGCQDLRVRILDSMGAFKALLLTPREQQLFAHDGMPFGSDVWEIFPTARTDIDEAAKCLALNRPTASVFHCMRAIEIAVQKLADELGAAVTNKEGQSLTWGVILSNLKVKIDILTQGNRKLELNKCHSFLHAVNVAVRNNTMHPNVMHTDDQAIEFFETSKTFMKALAIHCQKAD